LQTLFETNQQGIRRNDLFLVMKMVNYLNQPWMWIWFHRRAQC